MASWVIGSTSDFSKAVASKLDSVVLFGRDNIDYDAGFESFIKTQKTLPNQIFINIGIEEKITAGFKADYSDVQEMLVKFSKTWLWKLHLYTWFRENDIECVICDVTSSITMWPSKFPQHVHYAVMRAMGQQIAMANYTGKLSIIQASPNGITPERIDEYADKVEAWMREPENALGKIIDLDNNHLIGLYKLITK